MTNRNVALLVMKRYSKTENEERVSQDWYRNLALLSAKAHGNLPLTN
jgi:hypothetical protein